ncbi:MAG: Ig-like domain-containing protein, partial [Imperialibacter sp.]
MSLIKCFIVFSTLSALMISCIGTDLVEDTVSSVEIFSPQAFLNVNESLQMTSNGVNEFGDRFDVPTTWQSSDPAVATVDVNGIVFGVARGQVTITASYEGQA